MGNGISEPLISAFILEKGRRWFDGRGTAFRPVKVTITFTKELELLTVKYRKRNCFM